MTPEGRIKALVKRELVKEWPDIYQFMPVQNGMGAPALDFFDCIGGRFVAIETKAPGKEMTARQQTTTAAIRRAGGLVYVVDGRDSLFDAIHDIWRLK